MDDAPELVIEGRQRDVDGFAVRRVLPHRSRRAVGPFVFFDHLGPTELPAGRGLDVRPHPHINLATVTYLFEGEIVHRDSLGVQQAIQPGAINWMTAGRGIVHSERTSPEQRAKGSRLHLIQLWVGLPTAHEEMAPEFHHHPEASLSSWEERGVRVRLLAGSAYGRTSDVRTFSPLFYAEVKLPAGGEIALPDEHAERAAFIVDGQVSAGDQRFDPGRMLVWKPRASALVRAQTPAHLMLLGGSPLDGPRHVYWNFVSSSPERIERAKQDWKHGRFAKVPGDEVEFVPLPET